MSPIRMSERTSRLYYLVGGAIIAAIFAAALCAPAPQPTAAAMGFVPQPQQHQAQEPLAPIATIQLAHLAALEGAPGLVESIRDIRLTKDGAVAHIDLAVLIQAQRCAAPAANDSAVSGGEEE